MREYYHSNKDERFLESVELAQEILAFFLLQKDNFKFKELDCFVDSADPGFTSLLNTEARTRIPDRKLKIDSTLEVARNYARRKIVGLC